MKNVNELLLRTSRTFALTIPTLPEPTRTEVGIAYLLFRIADTFEDATVWSPSECIAGLREFGRVLEAPGHAGVRELAERCRTRPPVEREEYVDLLIETPYVLARFDELRPEARTIIASAVLRTIDGMANVVARTDSSRRLVLKDIPELREYCYIVAGIVGEMLTELYLSSYPSLAPEASALRERAAAFGEALQLVNIVKDARDDVEDGRSYLPASVPRADVFALARTSLTAAAEYTHAIFAGGGPPGLVLFHTLLVRLAQASLDRVNLKGPGAKLSRAEVWAIFAAAARDVELGTPLAGFAPTAPAPEAA